MAESQPLNGFAKIKAWLIFVPIISMIGSFGVSYGTREATKGAAERQLVYIEDRLTKVEQLQDASRDKYATQQQVREWIGDLKDLLKEIKEEQARRRN